MWFILSSLSLVKMSYFYIIVKSFILYLFNIQSKFIENASFFIHCYSWSWRLQLTVWIISILKFKGVSIVNFLWRYLRYPFFFIDDIIFGPSSEQGYSEAQLKECLEEYAALNVWQIHPNTFDIRFIDA